MSERKKLSSKPIEELKWYEHIRLRPGMYIGQVGTSGFMNTLKGIINSEIEMLDTNELTIELKEDRHLKMQFNVPKQRIEDHWSDFKRNEKNALYFEFFILNALSERFVISFWDTSNQKIKEQRFEKGVLISGEIEESISCSSIEIDCTLDDDIWGHHFEWNTIYLTHHLREFAYLFKNTKFILKYKNHGEDCKEVYFFKNGLKDRIDIELMNGLGGSYFATAIDTLLEGVHLEVTFAFRDYSVDTPYLKSYGNNYFTSEDGTHVDGLLKGLTYGVMKYFQKYELIQEYKISEKGIKENLVAAINVKLEEPLYSGCVKNKLANAEIIEPIAKHISEVLFEKMEQDEKATEQLIRKFKIY